MDRILELFKSLSIKVKYITSDEKLAVPFGVYRRLKPELKYADDRKFYRKQIIMFELYASGIKQLIELENELETLLSNEKAMSYTSSEDILLDDKKTILKYYEIEVFEI